MGELLLQAGVPDIEIIPEDRLHRINEPNEWWTIVRGTGYRGTLEQLDAGDYELVRRANLDDVRERGINAVQTNALYAFGHKAC